MAFFIQLVAYWIILWIISFTSRKSPLKSHTLKGRISFSLSFIIVGIMHLIKPESLIYMIEDFLPFPKVIVYITGFFEILSASLLLTRKWQKKIGIYIIIYLILVFPANINVAFFGLPAPGGLPSEPWYLWSRLAFQPIYILWVYFSALKSKHPV